MRIVPVAQFYSNIVKNTWRKSLDLVLSWYARQERLSREIIRQFSVK
jgi:hypothetical protein